VFAGIADILTFIESDHVSTGDYQALFVDMAKALIELQATDGFWRSSLLDQSTYSQPETSGTALFVYGLAWGINNGVLDKETYFDATLQGWRALESAIQPDGKLGWAQTYAASPGFSNIDGNYLYATGAFLLASDEVYKLIQNQD